jgi:DNA-binding CsgD family transcriptional regulator
MSPLTDKQRRVFALAVRYHAIAEEPCSTSWLARRLHRHRATIRGHALAIVKKGWASRNTPAFRGLHL